MNLGVDIEESGLGLYISKEIIESYGGEILVQSKERHKGAIFTIRLFKNRLSIFLLSIEENIEWAWQETRILV